MSFKINVDMGDLNIDLANTTIGIPCRACGAINRATLGQVRRGETITCVGCHKSIKLVDKDKSTAKTITSVNTALDELRSALESSGR